jgi:arylsulfatase
VFNLRADPFEQRDGQKADDIAQKMGIAWGGQVADLVGAHMQSLQQFPPRQKSGTLKMGETPR